MKQVLMISPHFPPDTTAGTHRVRLLAPHLPAWGWRPTVLTVDPRDHEGRLDPELYQQVPAALEVVTCRALAAAWTRPLGLGDLGLRALPGLWRRARALLADGRFDALFLTIYPSYPAVLGPLLAHDADIPFVLDLQDPWVGAWGAQVGAGPGGRVDAKSRATRALATVLEPWTVRRADAVTAVSQGTLDALFARRPDLPRPLTAAFPLGGEPADFAFLADHPRTVPGLDPADGRVHLVSVGTLLPLALDTLHAIFAALAALRTEHPALAARLRLHFYGTSNQTHPDAPARALPLARELGVADQVHEFAPRLPYLDALAALQHASAVLLVGSNEPHYTASRLYPALLARRPLLAVYHQASTVVDALRQTTQAPTAQVVSFGAEGVGPHQPELVEALARLAAGTPYDPAQVDLTALDRYSAHAVAGQLAGLLDETLRVRRR